MTGTGDCAGRVADRDRRQPGHRQGRSPARLAAEGAAVCVTGRTAIAGLAPAPRLARGDGRRDPRRGRDRATAVAADLADPTFDRATHRRRGPRGVRRAGRHPRQQRRGAPHLRTSTSSTRTARVFMEAVEVNAWAAWELERARRPRDARARPRVDRQRLVGSAGPKVGPPYPPSQVGAQVLYGATKAMLDRMTTGAAMELFDDHIAVNTLAPEAAILTENASTLDRRSREHRRAGRDVRRGDARAVHRRPGRPHRARRVQPVAARRAAIARCAPSTARRSSPAGSPPRSSAPASARATSATPDSLPQPRVVRVSGTQYPFSAQRRKRGSRTPDSHERRLLVEALVGPRADDRGLQVAPTAAAADRVVDPHDRVADLVEPARRRAGRCSRRCARRRRAASPRHSPWRWPSNPK